MLRAKKLSSLAIVFLLASTLAVQALQNASQAEPAKPKTAGEVFKNVQVMKDMPENLWFATMSFFTDALGVSCQHCHEEPAIPGNWHFERDTPAKLKARKMITMVREMNEKVFDGVPAISCNSCHQGTLRPVAVPAADLEHWVNSSKTEDALPAPEDLIARYRKVTGIQSDSQFHTQAISFKTTTYHWKTPPAIVTSELVIAGPDQIRMATQGSEGRIVSARNGKDGWVEDAAGRRPMQGGELRNLSNEASAFELEGLGQFTAPKTLKKDKVYGHDAYLVEATNGHTRTWLFFDAQTGLLLRQRSFFPSFFADGSWDVEFDDYRPVDKLTLPFMVRVVNPAGSGAVIRQATSRALDVQPDAAPAKKP